MAHTQTQDNIFWQFIENAYSIWMLLVAHRTLANTTAEFGSSCTTSFKIGTKLILQNW